MATRREFIKGGIKAGCAAGIATALTGTRIHGTSAATATPPAVPGQEHPIRIGGPLFFSDEDPEAWARHARELGYTAVYSPQCDMNDADRIKAIVRACEENGIVIAEVGCWNNMMDARPGAADKNIAAVTEALALADELNAKCCVNIPGSFAEDPWYGPAPQNLTKEFFDQAVENAHKIIDAVKPKRAKFAYEITGWGIPSDTDGYLRMIGAIDRKEFGVHLDVCNMVNCPSKFWGTTDLVNDAFNRLGGKMVSSHAKDLVWEVEMNIHFVECAVGEGKVDIATILKRLSQLPSDVPFMIEHMSNEEEYTRSRENIFKIAKANGVQINK